MKTNIMNSKQQINKPNHPKSRCFSISMIFFFICLFVFSSWQAASFFSIFSNNSNERIPFSASCCFFCAVSTASTEECTTIFSSLEFRSCTSLIFSSSCSCSFLLSSPFLFRRSSLLLCSDRLIFCVLDNSVCSF